ncbi:TadE/TadG family type IV pilus assembly protein [Streptomyces sp. NPDC090106]|uniref:TadE/TadG family type IV pilus assembly protein n=1 Tax=Streptomyces sp. NPDC090106 TaxID=3365946 RepID=UPI0037F140E5
MSYDGKSRAPGPRRGRERHRTLRDRERHRTLRDRERHRTLRDRGQAALEYLGFIPVLILVALAGVQVGLVAYTAQQAGTAARAGARAASLERGAQDGCVNAVSGWLSVSCSEAVGGDEVTVTASVDIPSVVPGWDFGDAHRTATMPLDH